MKPVGLLATCIIVVFTAGVAAGDAKAGGKTPLDTAREKSHEDIVRLLKKAR